jgi:hypothetical protein
VTPFAEEEEENLVNASFCLGGSKAREAGLKPAGEDGTYFQFFNLKRSVANSSTVSVNGKA